MKTALPDMCRIINMQKPKKRNKEIPEYERGRERGRREGINEGYEFAMVIILMVLKDKFGTSNEEIRRIAEDIQSYTGMVMSGRIRFDLMKNTLLNEYGISFKWRKDGK